MREQNNINMHFIISAVCLTIFSSTFLFMPVTNNISASYARYASIAIGIVFWVSGLIGYGILIYLYFEKKKAKKEK